MNPAFDIIVVAAIIGAALAYLGWKGYRRVTNRAAACGGCGSACGGVEATGSSANPKQQVVQSIELLTVVTAEDRGL